MPALSEPTALTTRAGRTWPAPARAPGRPSVAHAAGRRLAWALGLPVLLGAAGWAALPAAAQPVRTEHVTAELVAAQTAVQPGQRVAIGLRLQHIPHWHTYWRNPGDSGLPTTLQWTLPEGAKVGAIEWPTPQRLPIGPLVNYGFEGDLLLPMVLQVPAQATPGQPLVLKAEAQWLVCREVCIPESASLALTLPVGPPGQAAAPSALAPRFDAAARERPMGAQDWAATGWRVSAEHTPEQIQLRLTRPTAGALASSPASPASPEPAASGPSAVGAATRADLPPLLFFPYTEQMASAAQFSAHRVADGYVLRLGLLPNAQVPARLQGLLVPAGAGPAPWAGARAAELGVTSQAVATLAALPADAVALDTAVAAADARGAAAAAGTGAAPSPDVPADTALWLTLLLALAGGMLLNLMPCVFPVLSIKLLGLAQHAQQPGALRRHALAYTAGVVLSFLALAALLLALRAAGSAVGWGFQLQSPGMVYALALLFFALGLNLFGAFEVGSLLPQRLAGWQSQRPGVEAFGSGVLAVLAASPCTAPFMGAALGVALTLSAPAALAVFAALGLGMALPYAALALAPGWRHRLPRPGAWMLRLKQLLAFPLWATVVWLLWVLGQQTDIDTLAHALLGLLLLALGVWLLGQWPQMAWARGVSGRAATGLTVAATVAGLALAWPAPVADANGSATAAPGGTAAAEAAATGGAAAAGASGRPSVGPSAEPALPGLPTGTARPGVPGLALNAPGQDTPAARSTVPDAGAGPAAAGPAPAGGTWLPYSEAELARQLAAGRPVFVDFTAAWCVSCQVNKRLVLTRPDTLDAFQQAGVVLMRADWTRQDPAISAALKRLGRSGVPVYLLQAPGQPPELLPEILTTGLVRDALGRLKASS